MRMMWQPQRVGVVELVVSEVSGCIRELASHAWKSTVYSLQTLK